MSSAFNSNYKTVMCVYWETGCPRQSTCIFAHSADELRPRMCPHGKKCRFDRRSRHFDSSRRPCGFFHPGENITKEEVFKRATEFSVAKPVAVPGSVAVKTKLCPDWEIGGCSNKECLMAHSKEELSPEVCKHGARCFFNPKRPDFNPEKKPCRLHHPGDALNKDEVFARALHKLQIKRVQEENVPKFVVKIIHDDEEEPSDQAFRPAATASISSLSAWLEEEADPDYDAPYTK